MKRLKSKKRVALVLSGGGVKAAAFHIGVCLALREKGFRFAGGPKSVVDQNYPDGTPLVIRSYVGSSAGSFISAILSAGYSLESLVNAFDIGTGQTPHFSKSGSKSGPGSLKPIKYKDMFSLNSKNWLRSVPLSLLRKSIITGGLETLIKERFTLNGLFTANQIERYLRESALPENSFKNLGVDLFVVGTQLNHSRKVIFGPFDKDSKTESLMTLGHATISQAVAASTSLPPIFAPYGIDRPDGKKIFYFDGEIRDTLSTHIAADFGADLVISSYSVQPYHYRDQVGSLSDYGLPAILNQALYQVIQQKISRHIKYQRDIGAIYKAIDGYFKEQNLPDQHRDKILNIIRDRVNYKPDVDYIYIHPRPENYQMFFADHFSLKPSVLESIVMEGFKSAIQQLRHFNE